MRTRVAVVAVAAVLVLGGCAGSRIERERHDGVECMVVRNPFGKPRAVDCNWAEVP